MATIDHLNDYLRSWLRWLRFRRAIRWGFRGLSLGLAGSLVLAGAAIFVSRILPGEFITFVATVTVFSLLLAAGAGYLLPVERMKAARFFDRQFGLYDRVSTALELEDRALNGSNPEYEETSPAASLIQQQLEDTVRAAGEVNLRSQMPFRLPVRDLIATFALLILAALLWTNGGKYFDLALHDRQVQLTIAKESNRIEAIQKDIESDPRLTPGQREALEQPLEDALAQLKEARTLEGAAAILGKTEEALQELADPASLEQASALRNLGKSLDQPGSPLEKFGSSLDNGDDQSAAESLQSLDLTNLTGAEKESIAENLSRAADALSATNPEIASQLGEAADDLQKGDIDSAQKALQNASKALSEAGKKIASSKAAQQAAGQIAEGSQRIYQSAAGSQNQNASNAGSGTGEGTDGQRGQGTGQGSNRAQSEAGQASSGGGAGRGEGEMSDTVGGEAGTQPIGQDNGPGDGGERSYDSVFAPERLGGENGKNVQLPGSGSQGEIVIGSGSEAPGAQSGSLVPYNEVFPSYQDAYHQALNSGEIPASFRSIIRTYFSSLEP